MCFHITFWLCVFLFHLLQKAYREWLCAVYIPFYVDDTLVKPCNAFCSKVEETCPFFRPAVKETHAGDPSFICKGKQISFFFFYFYFILRLFLKYYTLFLYMYSYIINYSYIVFLKFWIHNWTFFFITENFCTYQIQSYSSLIFIL